MMYKLFMGLVVGLWIMNSSEAITHANCGLSLVNGTIIEMKCSCPYGMIPHGAYCIEIDDQECPNGYFDIFENRCKCFKYKDNNNIAAGCVSLCSDGCLNGVCVGPGQCYCYEGYCKDVITNTCVPICEKECGRYSKCVAPGKCECIKGYALSSKSKECEPTCEKGCKNGNCTFPNLCTCNAGYLKSRVTNKCEPVCENKCGGDHGKCVAPGKCQCARGYGLSYNSKKCEPICQNGCKNGYCRLPNVCTCYKGYTKSTLANKCEPVCIGGCGNNGKCVAPGKCQCPRGYTLSARTKKCEPICRFGCRGGTICLAPEQCGYTQTYVNSHNSNKGNNNDFEGSGYASDDIFNTGYGYTRDYGSVMDYQDRDEYLVNSGIDIRMGREEKRMGTNHP